MQVAVGLSVKHLPDCWRGDNHVLTRHRSFSSPIQQLNTNVLEVVGDPKLLHPLSKFCGCAGHQCRCKPSPLVAHDLQTRSVTSQPYHGARVMQHCIDAGWGHLRALEGSGSHEHVLRIQAPIAKVKRGLALTQLENISELYSMEHTSECRTGRVAEAGRGSACQNMIHTLLAQTQREGESSRYLELMTCTHVIRRVKSQQTHHRTQPRTPHPCSPLSRALS